MLMIKVIKVQFVLGVSPGMGWSKIASFHLRWTGGFCVCYNNHRLEGTRAFSATGFLMNRMAYPTCSITPVSVFAVHL